MAVQQLTFVVLFPGPVIEPFEVGLSQQCPSRSMSAVEKYGRRSARFPVREIVARGFGRLTEGIGPLRPWLVRHQAGLPSYTQADIRDPVTGDAEIGADHVC